MLTFHSAIQCYGIGKFSFFFFLSRLRPQPLMDLMEVIVYFVFRYRLIYRKPILKWIGSNAFETNSFLFILSRTCHCAQSDPDTIHYLLSIVDSLQPNTNMSISQNKINWNVQCSSLYRFNAKIETLFR